MEKEYQAFNASRSRKTVVDFASYIGSLTDARITGVFLERHGDQLQPVLRNIHEIPVKQKNDAVNVSPAPACCGKCQQKSDASPEHCNNNQENEGNATGDIEVIVKESRFSDMLILDAEMSFNKDQTGVLSDLTKAVLTKSECPVMIAPYAFGDIEEIIFAYDGSASAVFAMKQFAYLFPGLTDKKLTVLQVNGREDETIKDRNNILGLLQMHYSAVGFRILTGLASDTLFTYLMGKQNAVVIMGAFGSHKLSQTYRQSTAEPLVKTINLPLFIAHHV
ncbi:MAG: hypothetical protein ABIR15_18680 [Chitinophagaceae bacterium]